MMRIGIISDTHRFTKAIDHAIPYLQDCDLIVHAGDNIDDADVALLGPQVAYTLENSRVICDKKNVPVGVIPMADYGLMNGDGVLKFALKLIEDYKK